MRNQRTHTQKEVNLCFIVWSTIWKAFNGVYHVKSWKIIRKMGITELLIVPHNLFTWQEAWTEDGETDWLQVGKARWQDHILSIYSTFTLEYVYWEKIHYTEDNWLGFKIGGRHITNWHNVDDNYFDTLRMQRIGNFEGFSRIQMMLLNGINSATLGEEQ